jgi:hypothetical protein
MSVGTSAKKDLFASAVEQAAAAERAIQKQIDHKEKGRAQADEQGRIGR